MGELTHIGEVLKGAIKSPDILADIEIKKAWRCVLGEAAARNAQPTKLRRGILSVCVKDSVWANQLALMKREIIRKLSAVTSIDISDIRFSAGNPALPDEEAQGKTE